MNPTPGLSSAPTTDWGTHSDPPAPPSGPNKRPGRRKGVLLSAQGEPLVWLTGGALAASLLMISGMLLLILVEGARTFWPKPVFNIETLSGQILLGEETRIEYLPPTREDAEMSGARFAPPNSSHGAGQEIPARRRLLRIEMGEDHFVWLPDADVALETAPKWALVVEDERLGRLFGLPKAFRAGQRPDAQTIVRSGGESRKHVSETSGTWIEGDARTVWEAAAADLAGPRSGSLVLMLADGSFLTRPTATIVRAYPANQLSVWQKLSIYGGRWIEFIWANPRQANSQGGVFPAIFGTVMMTLVMTVAVVPFGVLAALYLREYAKAGPLVSATRIAINNLAGVPSIVFGVFGLGFFCYLVGGTIDSVFFPSESNEPRFGKGSVLWASLTLALLTLPVVIAATEEAIAAVPNSMREGSFACGASKWQTIRWIVLPRALPGIMTGVILAIARGAGEVAPLMLVGVLKENEDLLVDGEFPYIHLDRGFMHLGFHIFDLGFQSQNSEAAKPMVFTTTLLLITLVAILNLTAVWLRARLRRRFLTSQF